MAFRAREVTFPVCDVCSQYVESVFTDPSFGEAYTRFLGITRIEHAHQGGGAFSYSTPADSVPPDFADRQANFGEFCKFLGERIRQRRLQA